MFPLPTPKKKSITKWQGTHITRKGTLEGFVVVYPAEGFRRKFKGSYETEKHFHSETRGHVKYAYNDGFFKEIPEKWYGKAFLSIEDVPSENLVTIQLIGKFIEVPFLPQAALS